MSGEFLQRGGELSEMGGELSEIGGEFGRGFLENGELEYPRSCYKRIFRLNNNHGKLSLDYSYI